MKSKVNSVIVVHPEDKEAFEEQYGKVIAKIIMNRIPDDKIDEVLNRLKTNK